jgi:phage repressor protein C with HTH and peptisase S24 domain
VEIKVAAGNGKVIPEFVETKYRQRYRLSWFREKGAKPGDVRTMRVQGDSMERTLFDGDKIAVDFGNTEIRNDAVYVIAVGEEARVKRLFRMTDGRVRIVSDNADKATYPDEFVLPDYLNTLAVLGRVIDKSGSGGL